MKQLYVCSKPIMDNKGELHRHLIGTLSLLDNKEYQFSYNLDDSPICRGLILSSFPDIHRVYGNNETRTLLDDYLPSENDTAFIAEILKKTGMETYDEWEWLLTFDADSDADTETSLFETLPDDIIRHDTPEIITDDDFEKNESLETDDSEDKSYDEIPDDEFEDEIPYYDDDDLDENISDESLDDIDEMLNIAEEFSNNDALFDFENVINENKTDANILENGKYIKELHKSEPEKLNDMPSNTVRTVTIKKTYRRKKSETDDFIAPPPENPMDMIQQRLLENQKQRQKQLEEKLKINPYETK